MRVHPTALVEEDVQLGSRTAIWSHAHVRHDTVIGEDCIVGGSSIIAYGVRVGNRVKINSSVYICHGVTLEDGVMVSAQTVFTNDRFPRAATPDLSGLRNSDPDESTRTTLVREGATIGANCTIGCDLTIGRFAMVGMGSIVTRAVPDFHLVMGSPARSIGCVCRCGELVARFDTDPPTREAACPSCGLQYEIQDQKVRELTPPVAGEPRGAREA
ncbi:MAG: N-acetyltransferase [bacterium]|nr:N-acetyltransferase [bacterium]